MRRWLPNYHKSLRQCESSPSSTPVSFLFHTSTLSWIRQEILTYSSNLLWLSSSSITERCSVQSSRSTVQIIIIMIIIIIIRTHGILASSIRMFSHEVCKRHFGSPARGTWLLINFLDVAREHSKHNRPTIQLSVNKLYLIRCIKRTSCMLSRSQTFSTFLYSYTKTSRIRLYYKDDLNKHHRNRAFFNQLIDTNKTKDN